MERLMKMFAALVALLSLPVEQRDGEAVKKLLADSKGYLEGDEAKGLKALDGASAKLATLEAALAKESEEIRRIQRAGLLVQGNQILSPSGRSSRLEMLADGRAFLSDETAKRFGAWTIWKYMEGRGRAAQCPTYIREVAESVCKDAESGRSAEKADLSPYTALTPDEFRAELIRNVEAKGTLFPGCRRVPLATAGTTKFPKRVTGLLAYWTAPAAQPDASSPTFTLVTLTPEKLFGLALLPNELFRSGLLADIGQFIGVELVDAIADALDDALVNGDASSDYGGITGILESQTIATVSAGLGHDTWAELDGTDISDAIAGMTAPYALPEARWAMHLSVLMGLRGKRNDLDQPIIERAVFGQQVPANVDGYPFTICGKLPARATVTAEAPYAIFGNLRYSHYLGMLREIEIATSDQVLFTSDQTAIRGLLHVDIAEADATAVVVAALAEAAQG